MNYILMCDIIDSRLKDQKRLLNDFKLCTNHLNSKFKNSILSPLTITLGDEFQGVITNLEETTKILIGLEEFIIENKFEMKLRYVVYYGKIETPINPDNAHGMLGEGLTSARETINKIKTTNQRFLIKTNNSSKDSILNNAFNIFQNIIDNWKIERDYLLISNLIKYRDYKIVAEKLDRDRSLEPFQNFVFS